MIDLFTLFNQIEAMKFQLEAMSQMVGSEIARQQNAAQQTDQPAGRKTFTRRNEIPGAPQQPEGKTDDNPPG